MDLTQQSFFLFNCTVSHYEDTELMRPCACIQSRYRLDGPIYGAGSWREEAEKNPFFLLFLLHLLCLPLKRRRVFAEKAALGIEKGVFCIFKFPFPLPTLALPSSSSSSFRWSVHTLLSVSKRESAPPSTLPPQPSASAGHLRCGRQLCPAAFLPPISSTPPLHITCTKLQRRLPADSGIETAFPFVLSTSLRARVQI